ncbi:hypothetical protein [Bradyrhizobium sp. Tv2a-2]|nr:hypothetical protein [Bradyrhizobium sp. Tv2a-2]
MNHRKPPEGDCKLPPAAFRAANQVSSSLQVSHTSVTSPRAAD